MQPGGVTTSTTCGVWEIKGKAGRPVRILVVEDNHDAADSLRLLLRLYGCEVTVAYSGTE
jgi:hypothetical protein